MNTRKLVTLLLLLVVLAAAAVPTLAADKTIIITEQEINDSYRVTNNPRRSVTDLAVDLQPGQAVVSMTVTYRGRDPLAVTGTVVPSISNGRVFWSVTSASVDGAAISADLLTQINSAISSSWRAYIRGKLPAGRITAVTISDADVQISYTGR